MKIALIIDTYFPVVGGGQINAYEISKRIASKKTQIDIVTRNCAEESQTLPTGLRVIKLGRHQDPNNYISKIIFMFEAFFYIFGKDYDLIHAHAFLPGITAKLLMLFKSKPTIFTVHGTSIGTNLLNPIAELIEKFILTKIRYTHQITVSRDFLKIKNVNKNISYIPNGVNLQDFEKVKTTKNKQPTLLFVGRLHRQKNLIVLLKAVKALTGDFPTINLAIVGEGPLKEDLKKEIKSLGIDNNVQFKGEKTKEDLIKLYKSSTLFVLPSIYEGQPLTLLEAWAAKLPVVVTNTGDCQYLVKDGQNGFLIKNSSAPEESLKVIVSALKSRNLAEIGQNGYNSVKNYTWDKAAEQTLKLYGKTAKS